MTYTRSEIKKHWKGDFGTTQENLGKYSCQVFDNNNNYVDYITRDTREEVKQILEEKYSIIY